MSLLSKESIKVIAESSGVSNLSDDISSALASDVEYRIREIAQEALKFSRHGKRSKVVIEDVLHAMKVKNVEPIYGYVASLPQTSVRYKKVATDTIDIYYVDDEDIALDTYLKQHPIPKVPLDVTFTAHWLAIEGIQPLIPENGNVKPSETVRMSNNVVVTDNTVQAPTSTTLPAEVKPLVQHVISKELQLYYEKITTSIFSQEKAVRTIAFDSLSSDQGLQPLLPYIVQLIHEQVILHLKNLFRLSILMRTAQCILDNPNLHIEPYLHQLMPAILTCIVGKPLCSSPQEDHFALRRYSSHLISRIVQLYGHAYHTLQPRITKTLLLALLDANKPYTTKYGGIVGLAALGHEVVRVLLISNLKELAHEFNVSDKQVCYDALFRVSICFLLEELTIAAKIHENPSFDKIEEFQIISGIFGRERVEDLLKKGMHGKTVFEKQSNLLDWI